MLYISVNALQLTAFLKDVEEDSRKQREELLVKPLAWQLVFSNAAEFAKPKALQWELLCKLYNLFKLLKKFK